MTPVELDDLLYGDDYEPDYSKPVERVPDAGVADWHLRKKIMWSDYRAEIEEAFKEAVTRMEERREVELARLDEKVDYHGRAVAMWHRALIASGQVDGKTVNLPAGSSTLKKPKMVLEVLDPEATRGFAAENDLEDDWYPELPARQRKDEQLLKTAVMESVRGFEAPEPGTYPVVTEDGQEVPGVRWVQAEDDWSSKAART